MAKLENIVGESEIKNQEEAVFLGDWIPVLGWGVYAIRSCEKGFKGKPFRDKYSLLLGIYQGVLSAGTIYGTLANS